MGAFLGVSKLFKGDLVEYAKKLGYREDNLLILMGDEMGLRERFPETYANLVSCNHHRDARMPMEYGRDLVASWLFEDYLFQILKQGSADFTVELSGADRQREILAKAKTSTTSDYLIRYSDGTSRHMEQMSDYTGYWAKKRVLDLRDGKYKKLEAEKSLLLAVAVGEQKFQIIDFAGAVPAKYLEFHWQYHKPAYQIAINPEEMCDLTTENLIREVGKFGG